MRLYRKIFSFIQRFCYKYNYKSTVRFRLLCYSLQFNPTSPTTSTGNGSLKHNYYVSMIIFV